MACWNALALSVGILALYALARSRASASVTAGNAPRPISRGRPPLAGSLKRNVQFFEPNAVTLR